MPEESGSAFRWGRASIGRGWSHPLKRGDVDLLVRAHSVEALNSVSLASRDFLTAAAYFPASRIERPRDIDPDDFLLLASASWQGIDGDVYWPPMTAAITIYPVPTAERAAARSLVLSDALPRVLRWIEGIERGPETGLTERKRVALYRQRDEVRRAGG